MRLYLKNYPSVTAETPDHVYIIAEPESSNIVFETTAPGMKAFQVTGKFKIQFLEYLSGNKLLSSEEIATADKNTLFEKYYYDDEKINQKKLAGLMYHNLGIDAYTKENHTQALNVAWI